MDFILGEKFYDVADFIFSIDIGDDYNKLVNTFDVKKLKDINIIYLHTMYKDYFFDQIKNLDNKFVVVTHNSDTSVNSVDNLPTNIIKWYSQNVNIKDDRIESLPIGLENSRWFPQVQKQRKILNKLLEQKTITNLVYMNHNVGTNVKERSISYKVLNDKKFVTSQMRRNGQNFESYIDNIYNHKFVICPEGNGIDTHRKWETLYLNTIPIEKRCVNSTFYDDLPVCLVDNWEEITEDFLNAEYDRIRKLKWNMDKLDMLYWRNKIQRI